MAKTNFPCRINARKVEIVPFHAARKWLVQTKPPTTFTIGVAQSGTGGCAMCHRPKTPKQIFKIQ
jgi:hypothetical protein